MSADKRTVATDALATLGTIIGPDEKRDAIHLAVEPVVAGKDLAPGEHVIVKDGVAYDTNPGKGLGIVDPFLVGPVKKGDRFWFILYPRQVQSLRHVWSHPAFPDEVAGGRSAAEIDAAKKRIAEIAGELADSGSVEEGHYYGASVPMTYERLMDAAERWLADEYGYTTEHGGEDWRSTFPQYVEEFWNLYHVVTGRAVPLGKRESFFSCTC